MPVQSKVSLDGCTCRVMRRQDANTTTTEHSSCAEQYLIKENKKQYLIKENKQTNKNHWPTNYNLYSENQGNLGLYGTVFLAFSNAIF